MPAPFDEEKQIQQLVSLYRGGFEEILRVIVQKEAKGQWTQYWRDLLLEVRAILQQLDQYSDQWIEQTIGQVYSQAAAQTAVFLSQLGMQKPQKPEFAQVHQRAIDVVAQNMADNLRDASQFIGRRVNDVFRQVGLEQTGRKLAAGATVQDMKRKVVQGLLDQGQTAFVDRRGRKWRLDSYAEMVARTTTREAASVATINTCDEFGLDLVRISTHSPTCELCAPLQGKVYSISGNDDRYPMLTDERRPPIHPNCRHVLAPYVRELDDDAEETERRSNEPLNVDPRSEAEKQAYAEMRDAVTIATNRRRAREVLLSENAPLVEKVKAAEKLERTYTLNNKRPVGADAALIAYFNSNKDRFNAIIISESIAKDGPIWREGKAEEHLLKRKAKGHIPEDWKLEDYNRKIIEVCTGLDSDVYRYTYPRTKRNYFVYGDGQWIAIVGANGAMETAFPPIDRGYRKYLDEDLGAEFLGKLKDLYGQERH